MTLHIELDLEKDGIDYRDYKGIRDLMIHMLKVNGIYRSDPELVYRGMSRYRYNSPGKPFQDGVQDLLTCGSQRISYRGRPMSTFCGNTEHFMFNESGMQDPTVYARDSYGVFDASRLRLIDNSSCIWEFLNQRNKPKAVVAVVSWLNPNNNLEEIMGEARGSRYSHQ